MKKNFIFLVQACLFACIAAFYSCDKGQLPVLTTVPAADIKATSALLGGQISDDGGAEVISRGICWGTKLDPEISGSRANCGKGLGDFTCTLTGLSPKTLYHARAFATNSEGTAYGDEVQFATTAGNTPVVVTLVGRNDCNFYDILVGVEIPDDGGAPVTEKGICWGREF